MKQEKNNDEMVDWRLKLPKTLADRADEFISSQSSDRTKAMAKILTWFLDLPPLVRVDALGQLPGEHRQDFARLLLLQMAEGVTEDNVAGRIPADSVHVTSKNQAARRLPPDRGTIHPSQKKK